MRAPLATLDVPIPLAATPLEAVGLVFFPARAILQLFPVVLVPDVNRIPFFTRLIQFKLSCKTSLVENVRAR